MNYYLINEYRKQFYTFSLSSISIKNAKKTFNKTNKIGAVSYLFMMLFNISSLIFQISNLISPSAQKNLISIILLLLTLISFFIFCLADRHRSMKHNFKNFLIYKTRLKKVKKLLLKFGYHNVSQIQNLLDSCKFDMETYEKKKQSAQNDAYKFLTICIIPGITELFSYLSNTNLDFNVIFSRILFFIMIYSSLYVFILHAIIPAIMHFMNRNQKLIAYFVNDIQGILQLELID